MRESKEVCLIAYLYGTSSRALHKRDNGKLNFDPSCPLWDSSTLLISPLSVFRSKGGFLDNIANAAISSAWRSLMDVDDVSSHLV